MSRLICKRCGEKINTAPEQAGQRIDCPVCKLKIIVPKAAAKKEPAEPTNVKLYVGLAAAALVALLVWAVWPSSDQPQPEGPEASKPVEAPPEPTQQPAPMAGKWRAVQPEDGTQKALQSKQVSDEEERLKAEERQRLLLEQGQQRELEDYARRMRDLDEQKKRQEEEQKALQIQAEFERKRREEEAAKNTKPGVRPDGTLIIQ